MARIISCTEPVFIEDEKKFKNPLINIDNVDAIEITADEDGLSICFTRGEVDRFWHYDKDKKESFERDIDLLKTNQFQLLNRG